MRTTFLIVLIIILGISLTSFTWVRTNSDLAANALEQAQIIANSIEASKLLSLEGNELDIENPSYISLKQQLTRVLTGHNACRFLYLMGSREDGSIFFYLDSQSPDSDDYAPPGLVYLEVSDEYLETFATGKPQTVGPVKDRWGSLVTALVPIFSPDTNKLIAVLGMDIDANDWDMMVLSQCLIPIVLTIFSSILIFLVFVLNRNKQQIKAQFYKQNQLTGELKNSLEQVKRLQGILPICSKCKKIRDDDGKWNQIETYIRKNSETDFSHSICPTCEKELYGQEEWYKKRHKDDD